MKCHRITYRIFCVSLISVLCIQLDICASADSFIQDELDLQNLIGFEGNSRLSAGNFTQAEQAFRTIVRVSPGFWPAHYSLAASLLNQCRYTQQHTLTLPVAWFELWFVSNPNLVGTSRLQEHSPKLCQLFRYCLEFRSLIRVSFSLTEIDFVERVHTIVCIQLYNCIRISDGPSNNQGSANRRLVRRPTMPEENLPS